MLRRRQNINFGSRVVRPPKRKRTCTEGGAGAGRPFPLLFIHQVHAAKGAMSPSRGMAELFAKGTGSEREGSSAKCVHLGGVRG